MLIPEAELDSYNIKQQYLKSHGSRCPLCKSDDIEGVGGYDANDYTITQEVRCLNCGGSWVDCYTLTDVDCIETKEEYDNH